MIKVSNIKLIEYEVVATLYIFTSNSYFHFHEVRISDSDDIGMQRRRKTAASSFLSYCSFAFLLSTIIWRINIFGIMAKFGRRHEDAGCNLNSGGSSRCRCSQFAPMAALAVAMAAVGTGWWCQRRVSG